MVKVAQNDPMWSKIADIVPDNLDNPALGHPVVYSLSAVLKLKKWVILSKYATTLL